MYLFRIRPIIAYKLLRGGRDATLDGIQSKSEDRAQIFPGFSYISIGGFSGFESTHFLPFSENFSTSQNNLGTLKQRTMKKLFFKFHFFSSKLFFLSLKEYLLLRVKWEGKVFVFYPPYPSFRDLDE